MTDARVAQLARAVGAIVNPELSRARWIAHRDPLHGESRTPLLARAWVRRHLRRAGVLADVEVIARSDEVPHPKPAPGVYQLGLERVGVAPGECVAVEELAARGRRRARGRLACIAIPSWLRSNVAKAEVASTSAGGAHLTEVVLRTLRRPQQ